MKENNKEPTTLREAFARLRTSPHYKPMSAVDAMASIRLRSEMEAPLVGEALRRAAAKGLPLTSDK